MAVSFVNSSSTNGSGVTSLSVTKPSGTADGDLIILVALAYNSTISATGFTTIDAMSGGINPTNHKCTTFYKFASSEPTSWSVSFGTSTWPIAVAYVLRGVASGGTVPANHVVKADGVSYVTSMPTASGTIGAATDACVYIYAGIDSPGSGTETLTMDASLNNQVQQNNASVGGIVGMGWGINLSAPAAATCSPDGQDYMDAYLDFTAQAAATPPPKYPQIRQAVKRASYY